MIARIGATPTVSRQNISNRKNNLAFGLKINKAPLVAAAEKRIHTPFHHETSRLICRVYHENGDGPANEIIVNQLAAQFPDFAGVQNLKKGFEKVKRDWGFQ